MVGNAPDFEHDIFVRHESVSSQEVPAPPVGGDLSVERQHIAAVEAELPRRPGGEVELGHRLQLLTLCGREGGGREVELGMDGLMKISTVRWRYGLSEEYTDGQMETCRTVRWGHGRSEGDTDGQMGRRTV